MTEEHQEHLDSILTSFKNRAAAKYIKGQNEHGGALWLKEGLLDQAIDEAIDQVIYLITLKQQTTAQHEAEVLAQEQVVQYQSELNDIVN